MDGDTTINQSRCVHDNHVYRRHSNWCGCAWLVYMRKERVMKLAFIVTMTAIVTFGALAYLFHHWWIALFSILFMYSFERREED